MKKAIQAWQPVDYTAADVTAVQAILRGEANEDQQKRAMKWIIETAAATYEMSYRPASTHDTAFSEGRRFVGNQIIKLSRLNASTIARRENA